MKVINKHIIFIVAISIAFGAFVFGYSLVAMSMMAEIISQSNAMTSQQKHFQLSIITTMLPIGAFLGSFTTESLVNKIGERKAMLMLDTFAFFVITYQANNIDTTSLYITRFLLGIYFGISGSIIPPYLVSISPPQMRGLIGSFNQLLITVGISVAYKLGMNSNIGWTEYNQFPAYFCILRAICLIFFKYDTLQRHHRLAEKYKLQMYVGLFYENGSVEELYKLRKFTHEVTHMHSKHQVAHFQVEHRNDIWGYLSKFNGGASKKVMMLGFVLAIANQLSGINAIIYYAKQLFERVSDEKTALQYTFNLGLMQVIVTFFSGFMINNYGRRTLMLVGQSLIVLSLVSAYFFEVFLKDSQNYITGLIFLHLIGFSLSLGPVTMVYISQIMTNINFIVNILWILTILVSLTSEIMISAWGIGKVFLFYGLVSLACLIYMQRYMVESKGLSRQEVVSLIESSQPFKNMEEQNSKLHDVYKGAQI